MSKLEIRNVPKMERESREDLKHILAKITYFRFDYSNILSLDIKDIYQKK